MKFRTGLMLALASVLAGGCSTSVVPEEPDVIIPEDDGREITMDVRVMQNGYTRASEGEDAISSLYLAFYALNGDKLEFISLKEATAKGSGTGSYSVRFTIKDKIPDIVVAFANISDQEAMKNAIGDVPATVSALKDASNNLVMSSARYYDTRQSDRDVYYSVITEDNIKGISPLDIHLERVAAKVTVVNMVAQKEFRTLDVDGNERPLTLTLTGWNLTATDKSSYLLKNNGGLSYSQMEAELGLNGGAGSVWTWNDASRCSLNWSHSVNWGLAGSAFPAMGTESAESTTKHVMFSEVNKVFGEGNSEYVHETTRPSSLFSTSNAKPMLVLAGNYTLTNAGIDLYRRGDYVITYDELVSYFVNNQQEIYTQKDGKTLIDENGMKIFLNSTGYFAIITPDGVSKNLVTLQASNKISGLGQYYDKSGVSLSSFKEADLAELNRNLREQCGLWEIYDSGNCVYLIPVEQLGKQMDADGVKTGSYGIVRNHHYKINIKSITGFGYGVPGSDTYIGEMVQQNEVTDASNVTYNVSVNAWNEVTQNVE